MTTMPIEVVSAERRLWSGEAEMVIARTVDGEIGILPGHAPVLAALPSGVLRILTGPDQEVTFAVHGGFLSVSETGVSVLADIAELGDDIDLARAQAAYDHAAQTITTDDDPAAKAALERARTRLRVRGVAVA